MPDQSVHIWKKFDSPDALSENNSKRTASVNMEQSQPPNKALFVIGTQVPGQESIYDTLNLVFLCIIMIDTRKVLYGDRTPSSSYIPTFSMI